MANLVLKLEEQDLLELQEILLDEDEKGALDFLKSRIAARLPVKENALCDSNRNNPYLANPGERRW